MAELNRELYQIWTDVSGYGSIAYDICDSTHPSTYQSFATTGQGTIDQSIFPYRRQNDAWSYGAYFSFMWSGNAAGYPTIEVCKNNFSKNQGCWLNEFELIYSDNLRGNHYIDNDYYSPLTPTISFYRPWISFAVNRAVQLVPRFGLIFSDGTTRNCYYDEIETNHWENEYCTYCVIELYNSAGNLYANPMSIQYAGKMIKTAITGSGMNERLIRDGDITGVFLFAGCGYLFNAYATNSSNTIINANGCTLATPFDITQMDTSMMIRQDGTYMYTVSLPDIVKVINSIGVYWAKNPSSVGAALGQNCTDPNIVAPVVDENHQVTDTILTGSEIGDYARQHADDEYCWFNLDYGAGTDPETGEPLGKSLEEYIEDPEYDNEQTTTEPVDEIHLNVPETITSGGNSIWIMSQRLIDEFFTWLWNPNATFFDDIVKGCALLGENPMDSVVTLKLYPFSFEQLRNNGVINYASRTICFGRIQSATHGFHLTTSNVIVFDLGSFKFNDSGMFKDFRDYEPYSDYSLYIPFVGIIPLQAIECINTTISVKMIVDIVVGSCTAVIFTNGVPYKYVDGQIGIDMPVTGRNLAQYGRTILQGALAGAAVGGKAFGSSGASEVAADNASNGSYNLNMAKQNINTGAYASEAMETAKMGALGALGAAMPVAGALAFTVGGAALGAAVPALLNNPAPQTAGCNAPATGLSKPLFPYFIVRRSDCWIPENYNHLYGRPVQQGGKVSDFHGFCKFGNLNLSGLEATETEKLMINDTLQNGVII